MFTSWVSDLKSDASQPVAPHPENIILIEPVGFEPTVELSLSCSLGKWLFQFAYGPFIKGAIWVLPPVNLGPQPSGVADYLMTPYSKVRTPGHAPGTTDFQSGMILDSPSPQIKEAKIVKATTGIEPAKFVFATNDLPII